MTELHSTTSAVLQAIKAFWAEEGYSPSIRDIMDEVGITSTSVIRYHIIKLERAGLIKRTPGVARSYVPIERDKNEEGRGNDCQGFIPILSRMRPESR